MKSISTSNDFDDVLLAQATAYGAQLAQVLEQFGSFKATRISVGKIDKSLAITADHIVSLPFVGSVTGEFIVSLSNKDASVLFPQITDSEEIHGMLTESLNVTAGACLNGLTQMFQKLTMTPPRIATGKIRYPNLKNVKITLESAIGEIHAYFFIDRMKLDLAESYKQVISELTSTNEDLNIANTKLMEQQTQLIHSEKMASLGMMAAGVAHEINNPLAFVVSNSDVLNSYVDAMRTLLIGYDQLLSLLSLGKKDEARTEYARIAEIKKKEDLEFILEDTRKLLAESKFGLERIRSIVNGLKRFSRIEDTGYKRVQINEEIQNTLMLLQNELKYKCQVESDFRAKREVECMPGELSQVFLNLIVNAAHAIKGTDGLIRVTTVDTAEYVHIEVSDNGIGISKDNLSKIFSPFFTTKPVGEGTGLGLAITHGIVEKHHGKIAVESTPGVGTTFKIDIPYVHVEDASGTPSTLAG